MPFFMSNFDNITEAKRAIAKLKIQEFLLPFVDDWIPGRIKADDEFEDSLADLIEDLLSVAGSDFEYEAFAAAKQAEIALASVQHGYAEMADELLSIIAKTKDVPAGRKETLEAKYGRREGGF